MLWWADNKLVKHSAVPSNGRIRCHNIPHHYHHYHDQNSKQLHKRLKNNKLIVRRYGNLPGSVPLDSFNSSETNTGEANLYGHTKEMSEKNHSITGLQGPTRRPSDNASFPKIRHSHQAGQRMSHDASDADVASTNINASLRSGELKMMVTRLGGYDPSIQFVIRRWPKVGEIFLAAICALAR